MNEEQPREENEQFRGTIGEIGERRINNVNEKVPGETTGQKVGSVWYLAEASGEFSQYIGVRAG